MNASENESRTETSRLLMVLGIGVAVMHIWFNVVTVLPSLWQNSLHFAGFALIAALVYPLRNNPTLPWKVLDMALGVLAAGSAVYLIAMEDAIYERGVTLAPAEWVAGIILILCALEFTRRAAGWFIPVLIIIALSYVAWWGKLVGGVFKFAGLSLETILFRSVYGDDAMFGTIASISSTYVFMFILFGAFLLRSGAGEFVIDLARAVAGRMVGGPGLVAVMSSGLMGTISGSAIANTASTGVITIPLMKRAGFPAKFAAGVEAAASTGGQLMPPIMGAGAFVMATYTQISYNTIVLVSILPAILYFATVAFFVRIEAKRSHVHALDGEKVSALEVLKKGGIVFLLPIGVLIALLIYGFTPTYAAGLSIVSVVVASWFSPNKMGLKAIVEAMVLGARNMVMTAILLCAVGLIVNVIATAGVGNTFSMMITEWAGSSMLIAIILIALASLVLGMGLPVTAAYIVLGTLSAPALHALIADGMLVDALAAGQIPEAAKALFMIAAPDKLAEIGNPMTVEAARAIINAIPIDMAGMVREAVISSHDMTFALLSAHLIVFWLSQDSNVTPPVALAAFTGAAIAGTKPMETGIQSWKVAKGLYIVPLLFAYTSLVGGAWSEVFTIFFFALFGLYAFTAALQGFMETKLSWPLRLLSLACAAALLCPVSVIIHIAGLAVLAVLFTLNFKASRRKSREGVNLQTKGVQMMATSMAAQNGENQ
ncbi:TRAP transporter, 4TM/12TM fusion protein [Malonomonas rubra DSM 5091]|uniref:TRAP transporter, 4TM/12TM fusion protein n=1 Tax=Malonomonas rubra DSM 5091 TaxID=1122189 RepID=A0A1M6IXV4_MALRU|nr:TRAP transporter fused permease subunit [Malonomonas rubra]SHJ39255.1 TRAP transporter, 4TM/12TM fusion protein [Malonomonas rubra DSM 5091]